MILKTLLVVFSVFVFSCASRTDTRSATVFAAGAAGMFATGKPDIAVGVPLQVEIKGSVRSLNDSAFAMNKKYWLKISGPLPQTKVVLVKTVLSTESFFIDTPMASGEYEFLLLSEKTSSLVDKKTITLNKSNDRIELFFKD